MAKGNCNCPDRTAHPPETRWGASSEALPQTDKPKVRRVRAGSGRCFTLRPQLLWSRFGNGTLTLTVDWEPVADKPSSDWSTHGR